MCYQAFLLTLTELGSTTGSLLFDVEADIVATLDESGTADVLCDCYLAWQRGLRPELIADAARLGRAA